jgi:hypothetical protein
MDTEIQIRLRPHPDNPKLTVKHVNSSEYMCPKSGPDGKLITGIDEHAYEIVSLEEPERTIQMKKVKKEREELEKLLGVSLTPESEYWSKFYVVISDEQNFDITNAKHRLLIHFLTGNKYVAPSLEEAETNDEYSKCVFYLFRKEEETSKLAKKKKGRNKAMAKLDDLETDPARLKTVAGYIFGYDPKSDLSAEEAYLKLEEYLNESPEKEKDERVGIFLATVAKTQEELMVKIVLDKAINKHIIKQRGGVYKRGDLVIGNSYEECIEFLADSSNSADLDSLVKEVSLKDTRSKK